MLDDVICNWKMTSFTALDCVTSFLSLKKLEIHVNKWQEFFSAMAGIWKKLKTSNLCVFVIYCVLESK